MKERIGPWLPAIFAAVLALIVLVSDLWSVRNGGKTGVADTTYMMFMPMCFVFAGVYFSKLRKDYLELRDRLDSLGKGS